MPDVESRHFQLNRGQFPLRRTNLDTFYHLGAALSDALTRLSIGMNMGDLVLELVFPELRLRSFIDETKDVALADTRKSAQQLYDLIESIIRVHPLDFKRTLTQTELQSFHSIKKAFESDFERELKNIAVFTVLPKGIYEINALLEKPEEKFSEKIRQLFPAQMLYDIRQAARCLAFELPTACAFHICRGTETFMLKYYEMLSGHEWKFKKRDWKIYIEQLNNEKAPKKITSRLDEIRVMDRNTYAHPDTNITLEEAPVIFELCTGVIFFIAQEMEKLPKQP